MLYISGRNLLAGLKTPTFVHDRYFVVVMIGSASMFLWTEYIYNPNKC